MIVVDSSVIVSICLKTPKTPVARELWWRDSDWHAPVLWISEFRNVLVMYVRHGRHDMDACRTVLADAHSILLDRKVHVLPDKDVVELAIQTGCTAYDCEFARLAQVLRAPLLTWDEQLLKAFPGTAVRPEDFLNMVR